MADSVGSGFPSTGINKGHIFYDFDESSMWMYLGGIPRLASSWVLLYGRLTSQPDTSSWGPVQAGAMWFLNGLYYGWDGTQIIVFTNGLNPNLYNYKNSIKIQDDFMSGNISNGQVGSLGWGTFQGTTSIEASVSPNRIGVYRRDTGAVINTVTSLNLYSSTNVLIFSNLDHEVNFDLRLNNNDANTTLRMGLLTSFGAIPITEGIYFEKLDGDTNWFGVCTDVSVSTRVNLGIPVNTNFHSFRYVRNSLGVQFKIDNVNVGSIITSNIPNTGIDPTIQIINSAAASKTFDVDYFELLISGLTR